MITLNDGTVLRNLEEQVLENKQQIALHWNVDRVLADFGIRVRGTLPSKAVLDQVDTADLQYGDAYFIGTAEPYDVWIWTRADVNAGKFEDYWLNIGHIAIEGPQGPQGPQGRPGPAGESTQFNAGSSPSGNPGDLYLFLGPPGSTANGTVFQINEYGTPLSKGSIMGPQGIQGPKGDKGDPGEQGPVGPQGPQGDVGGFINIYGILSSTNQLPPPTALNNLTAAFLVGTAAPYDLYIQMGASSSVAVWHNTGPFNAATAVSVAGVYQNVWDADTKLDKLVNTNTANLSQAYIELPNNGGTQLLTITEWGASPNTLAKRDNAGRIAVAAPSGNNDAANKKYVDDGFVAKQEYSNAAGTSGTDGTYHARVYGVKYDGAEETIPVGNQANSYSICWRDADANIYVGDPTQLLHCVNKRYAEANFVPSITLTAGQNAKAYIVNANGQAQMDIIPNEPRQWTLVQRGADGVIYTGTPTLGSHATTKQYVDEYVLGSEAESFDSVSAMIEDITGGEYGDLYNFLLDLWGSRG